LRIYWAQLWLL